MSSAPALLIMCSDHRLSRSRDIAVIECAIDTVCVQRGLCKSGESVEFDTIQVPGPQVGIANATESETNILMYYIEILKILHGTLIAFLTFHLGEAGDKGCGREYGDHNNRQIQLQHIRIAASEIRTRFPSLIIQILEIRTCHGRISSAAPISTRKPGWVEPEDDATQEALEPPLVTIGSIDPEVVAKFQANHIRPDTLLGITPGGAEDKLVPKT